MPNSSRFLSRRDFLKLAGLGLGSLALRPLFDQVYQPDFPVSDRLGRNCIDGIVNIKSRPDVNSSTVETVYEDTVLPWLREVNADNPDLNYFNQRWVETPKGFVYASYLQPCRNLPNQPLTAMPEGQPGFWAEVTVPYVDLAIDNPAPVSPWAKNKVSLGQTPRLYYSQVMWIDQIKTSEATGNILYRVNEKYGNPGDLFWGLGSAFRPLTEDEIAPLHPDVDPAEKKVVVNLTNQYLSCLEGEREVYFCRVSAGAKFDAWGNAVDAWATPLGEQAIYWKVLSIRMGNRATTGSYETPGIAWTSFFHPSGAAIHATFWHNDFGTPRSHGCVNCKSEDAKWIFRWTAPVVSLTQDNVTLQWPTVGTHLVVEARYF